MERTAGQADTTASAEQMLSDALERLERRDLDGLADRFHAAERAGADWQACAGGRWMAHMLAGAMERAWQENDALRARGAPDPHRLWQGEEWRGRRVMLRCLHGYGDAVQMLRYLPRLRAAAAELTVEVPPRFMDIAPCFAGAAGVRFVTWGEGAPAQPPAWDVQMELMELPYIFRTQAADLPLAEGYLTLPRAALQRAQACMPGGHAMRVGLVWSAGDWNPARSVPVGLLQPLLEVEGGEFWSLQGGGSAGEWKELAAGPRVSRRGAALQDAAQCGDGILNLAAAIAQLDLVITVDTLAAHLAGALGVPAWLLLQHAADWRWMVGRGESPWYPSLHLLRQAEAGDWSGLIAAAAASLRGVVARQTAVRLVG